MEACYGGTGVMERSCAVARGIDANNATAVSLLNPPPGSRSGLKHPLELLESSLYTCSIIVFQGGDDGRGYRNMCKIPRGSKPDLGH